MRKQTANLEWHIAESEAEWESQRALLLPEVTSAANRWRRLSRYGWSIAALFLLASAGRWLWHTDQVRAQQAKAEMTATAQRVLDNVAQVDAPTAASLITYQSVSDRVQVYGSLPDAVKNAALGAHVDVVLQTVDVQGDQVVAYVVATAKSGGRTYRQALFYRHMPTGWLRTDPDAALWGAERSLETPYFVYHFSEKDAAAVLAVAPQMDALYTTLRRNFGLPIGTTLEKRFIDVRVTQPPERSTVFDATNHISVASPAIYLAPVDLTDTELLAQAIVLPLLAQVLAQASEQHAVAESWRPLLNGLRLWQVWNLDLPLAVWREAVVTWIYGSLPATRPGQTVVLPARYTALCAAHKLWLLSLAEIKIPLMCGKLAWEELILPPWIWYDPQTRLDQLIVPLRPGKYMDESASLHRTPYPGETVVLATLIEYAVATYGRERLPALMAGLGRYKSWATLLPAVYGVSATDFETGWQDYLAVHYGVAVIHKGGAE